MTGIPLDNRLHGQREGEACPVLFLRAIRVSLTLSYR